MKIAGTDCDRGNEGINVYVLRLFVAGTSPNSIRAITNLKAICEKYLAGRYELEIIDVHQQAEKAEFEQLIALPMVIKKSPGTERRLIGDMSDTGKVLKGLGIKDAAI
ncbi:circadian clock KaiB family protein [Mucilaginibacter ginsenosidivorans]|uniref:Circadian clock protein KaiB n=1 Tax=Mucilaginibacter ginsenosidivorans TaxID=398053 RepID=A0A5B8UWE5_9SPHI|nr:circadian clock KaiB family protein [Mucilaginibacter ginsenosidivorans]QEC63457.1 circadian clock protein KaiB [Mucilaginibacter ginsenosidivorans]